ncbi:peptidoglycan DD-metalloendopeptidase family protein, partial [Patescibacteria group bacterium]|nr:peptidoglycan DD-metalloendopeptidase family protein [Patescibacteria group bacterium]
QKLIAKMRSTKGKFKKFLIAILIATFQVVSIGNVLADDQAALSDQNELFLMKLRQQLQNTKNDYYEIGRNVNDAKEKLIQVTEAITTLKDQIANLDQLINNTEIKIHNVEKQIAQKETQIGLLTEEIQIKEIELENQKMLSKEYLKLLYLQENSFYDKGSSQNVSVAKLLLGDESIGETFKEIQYLTILEQTGQNIFNKIDVLKAGLEAQQLELEDTWQKLARLNSQLIEEKKTIQVQRQAKEDLLTQTKGEEEIYRELIAQSKREQLGLVAEMNALSENLAFVRQKIAQDGENFNPDNYKNLITPNVRAIYDFETSGEYANGEILNWPVSTSRGISAYFHDAGYLATFGIPHNAIDIPVSQGTAIRAPANGVVYKVRDNADASYSYLILAHKNGILTVFGHVSAVLVEESDIVLAGEIVALSGGTPGTKGAGWLTTGAHLHFEVMKNGKHIDPLLVLPLDQLGEEYIPSYLKDFVEQPEDIKAEESL